VTVRLGLATTFALLLSSVSAGAQDSRPGRPYRGIFGPEGRDAAQVLSINGAVGVGYDTDVIAEQRDRVVSAGDVSFLRTDAAFSLFSGGVGYTDHGDRYDLRASVQSVARSFQQFATIASHHAMADVSWRVGRRTTLTGFQTAMYQPWGALVVAPAITDPDFGHVVAPGRLVPVLNGSYRTFGAGGTITQQLTRRSALSSTYRYDINQFSGVEGDFRSQEGTLHYTHNMTRNLAWKAGYVQSEARFIRRDTFYRQRTLDVGLDYSRYLSNSRRTRVGFSTGLASVDDGNYTRYRVTGTAFLNREIGRTWNAAIVYARDVAFFETLRVPYFYDGATVGLTGLINRSIQLHSSVGGTYGDVSVITAEPASNHFATGTGNVGLIFAFSRYMGVAVDYFVYAYSIDDASTFWYGLEPRLARQSVSVSLRAWLPLIERGRRSDATR